MICAHVVHVRRAVFPKMSDCRKARAHRSGPPVKDPRVGGWTSPPWLLVARGYATPAASTVLERLVDGVLHQVGLVQTALKASQPRMGRDTRSRHALFRRCQLAPHRRVLHHARSRRPLAEESPHATPAGRTADGGRHHDSPAPHRRRFPTGVPATDDCSSDLKQRQREPTCKETVFVCTPMGGKRPAKSYRHYRHRRRDRARSLISSLSRNRAPGFTRRPSGPGHAGRRIRAQRRTLTRRLGKRVGLIALRGSNPLSSASRSAETGTGLHGSEPGCCSDTGVLVLGHQGVAGREFHL